VGERAVRCREEKKKKERGGKNCTIGHKDGQTASLLVAGGKRKGKKEKTRGRTHHQTNFTLKEQRDGSEQGR